MDFLIGMFSFLGFVFIIAIVSVAVAPWLILITSKYWNWCERVIKGDKNG